MYRWIAFGAVVLIAIVVCAVFWYENETAASAPQLASDLYPLYSGVTWNAPIADSFVVGTTTFAGTLAVSATVASTTDPGSVFTPFEQYYATKLAADGWSADNDLAAGGATGGQTVYQKGNQLILAGFDVAYETATGTAPLQCPCDVTLSLFSGQ